MNAAVLAAGAAAFTSTASIALGASIVDHLASNLTRLERLLFSFLIGSSFLSLLVFFLTAVHLAYTAVFVLTGFVITALCAWKVRLRPKSNAANRPLPMGWLLLAVCLTAPFAALYFDHALSPESSADGVAYHLGLVARYFREHHFPTITTNFFANFPEGMEMLYLFGFSIGRHSAAALIHLAFLFVGGGLLVAYGIRFNRAPAGIGAAILFLLAPDVGITASSAYVDVGEASVCFGLFLALQIWKREGDDRMLAIAGVLAGFAAAIKYSGFIAPVYAVVTVLLHLRKQPKRFRYCLTLVVIPAALLIAPWLIKNVIEVGNPVSPFANRWFPNPYVHISFEDGIMARWRHWNGVTWKEIPMEVTIHGGRLQGIIGPAFLLAPVILLLFRDPLERQVLVSLLWFFVPYFGNIGTRFLILPLPFLIFRDWYRISALPLCPYRFIDRPLPCKPTVRPQAVLAGRAHCGVLG